MGRRLCSILVAVFLFAVFCPRVLAQQEKAAAAQEILEATINNWGEWMSCTLHDAQVWLHQFIEENTGKTNKETDTVDTEHQGSESEEKATAAMNASGEAPAFEDNDAKEPEELPESDLAKTVAPAVESSEAAETEKPTQIEIPAEENPETEEPTEIETPAEENPEEDPGETVKASSDDSDIPTAASSEAEELEHVKFPVLLVIGIVVLLAAGASIAAVLLIRAKKKQQKAIERTYQPTISAVSDSITITYLSGKKRGCMDVLFGKERYLIGASSECDLILNGTDVGEKHACIYTRDGRQYIEDLDSDDGTYVDGMRLYSANRLRKNNVVTIGMNSFKVTF